MPGFPYNRRLRLTNFTVFAEAEFEFSPGVNAFIGENGSGKTHLLKAIYAYQRPLSRNVPNIDTAIRELFQIDDAAEVIRSRASRGAVAEVHGGYGNHDWSYAIQRTSGGASIVHTPKLDMIRPVFIPAIDMMGHTKQFTQAYDQVSLDFDLTSYDLVSLLTLTTKDTPQLPEPHPMAKPTAVSDLSGLAKLLGGELDQEENGRFFLNTSAGRQPMPIVAEGLRKLATLVRLQQNGWIVRGTTLFWDEPEVNLNPILMGELVKAILTLARQEVQVFLTTHSYVILKELDLQATSEDGVRYFSLQNTKSGTRVTAADELAALDPNSILQEYGSLYNRDIRRAAGRKSVR